MVFIRAPESKVGRLEGVVVGGRGAEVCWGESPEGPPGLAREFRQCSESNEELLKASKEQAIHFVLSIHQFIARDSARICGALPSSPRTSVPSGHLLETCSCPPVVWLCILSILLHLFHF